MVDDFEKYIKSPIGYCDHINDFKVYRVPGGIILSRKQKEWNSSGVSVSISDTYIPFPISSLRKTLEQL